MFPCNSDIDIRNSLTCHFHQKFLQMDAPNLDSPFEIRQIWQGAFVDEAGKFMGSQDSGHGIRNPSSHANAPFSSWPLFSNLLMRYTIRWAFKICTMQLFSNNRTSSFLSLNMREANQWWAWKKNGMLKVMESHIVSINQFVSIPRYWKLWGKIAGLDRETIWDGHIQIWAISDIV